MIWNHSPRTITLIAKPTCDLEKLEKPDQVLDRLLHVWAKKEYKPRCSLVRKSLQEDWGYHAEDGIAITELGICCCIEFFFFPGNRHTMKDRCCWASWKFKYFSTSCWFKTSQKGAKEISWQCNAHKKKIRFHWV